jgi:hypothetical protein
MLYERERKEEKKETRASPIGLVCAILTMQVPKTCVAVPQRGYPHQYKDFARPQVFYETFVSIPLGGGRSQKKHTNIIGMFLV